MQQEAQLVITAPQPYGTELAYRTRCRTTLGVLTQLMAQAKTHVIISAPFLQAGEGISSGALSVALHAALQRGVDVDIVSTGQGLQTVDTSGLQHQAKGRLRLFRPQANITNERHLGSHAKFCLADQDNAYVGSANLTGPGLSGHLEMGLLVKGEVARNIGTFWLYCLEVGLFVLV